MSVSFLARYFTREELNPIIVLLAVSSRNQVQHLEIIIPKTQIEGLPFYCWRFVFKFLQIRFHYGKPNTFNSIIFKLSCYLYKYNLFGFLIILFCIFMTINFGFDFIFFKDFYFECNFRTVKSSLPPNLRTNGFTKQWT